MKNNRLTNEDLRKLRSGLDRIRELASLEKCTLSQEVKEEFKLYMMWFNCVADSMGDLLDGKDVEYYRFR